MGNHLLGRGNSMGAKKSKAGECFSLARGSPEFSGLRHGSVLTPPPSVAEMFKVGEEQVGCVPAAPESLHRLLPLSPSLF